MFSAALTDDTTAVLAPVDYTSFDDFLISFSIDRGRPDEWSKTEAGTASVKLQNRTGVWDPTNAAGPNYGDLLPLRQTQLAMANPITGGSPIPVYTGYIEDYVSERHGPNGMTTEVPMVDLLELLANADANTSTSPRVWGSAYAVQHVDDRIKAALADANVPAGKTRIATGNVDVQAVIYEQDKILTVIDDACDAEFPGVANRYVTKDGTFQFTGRGIRFNPSDPTYSAFVSFWTVGDVEAMAVVPDCLPIAKDGLTWAFGKENLYNDVLVAPEGASAVETNLLHKRDATSRNRYGQRSLPPITGLLVYKGTTTGNNAVDECSDYGDYFLNNYKVPRDRVTRIEFHGQMDQPGGALNGALWDFILNVDLGHVVNVNTTNPGGGGIDGVDYFVEGIHHSVEGLNDVVPKWTMTLDLSPRARFASYP